MERLSIIGGADPTRADWDGLDLVVEAQVARAAGLGGVWLPPTRVYRGVVRPVVTWDLNALAERLRSGVPPLLERAALRGLREGKALVACPVALSAFVCFSPLRVARTDLAALSVYARAVWVVPQPPGSAALEELECDVKGYTVVQASDEGARVVVDGWPGPDPACRPLPVQVRLYREQLYDVALRSGLVPPI